MVTKQVLGWVCLDSILPSLVCYDPVEIRNGKVEGAGGGEYNIGLQPCGGLSVHTSVVL